jgi:glycosyltransferase involved in cell wall biosynthesis
VNNPSISVVVPLFNKEPYVCRAVNSVLAQTFQDFEVVVINDGSTDNGPELVRQIQDRRIRLIDQKNAGVSAARNRGIHEAKSELIAFLDADDEWLPEFLQTIAGLADRYSNAGVYATGYLLLKGGDHAYRKMTIRGGGERCGCYFDLLRSGADIWTSSNIAVRRAVFNKVGFFRVGHKLAEDLDMWFRIGLHYRFACSATICALYHYYQPDNACHVAAASRVSPLHISLLELKRAPDIDPFVKQKAMKYLSRQLAKGIEHVLQGGFRDVARRRLRLYRRHYGVTAPYVRLCVLNMFPSFLLNLVTRLRLLFVRYVLTWRSNTRELCVSRPPCEESEEL